MASDASLVATLGANLDQFGNDMKRADQLAQQSVKNIEDEFSKANPSMKPGLDKMGAEAESSATTIGLAIGTAITVGIGLAIKKMSDLIEGLAKIGDRADEIRLPVNTLQALSVAADAAGVSQASLNSALDAFTKVSKKTEDDAEDLHKALSNINEDFSKQFVAAKTQVDRLNIISNAYKAATTEVQRAQLAQQAFGTDSEKVGNLLGSGADEIARYRQQIHALGLEIDESAVKRAQEARGELALMARVLRDELSSSLGQLIPTFQAILPYFERAAALFRDLATAITALNDAAKPVELLQREQGTLENEINKLEAEKDRISKIVQEPAVTSKEILNSALFTARDWLRAQLGELFDAKLTENEKDLDDRIAAAKARIAEIDGLIKGKQSAAAGAPAPPAFVGRPSLTGGGDTKDAFERQSDSIKKHIALMDADAKAVGATAGEHERLRVEAELTAAAQKDGGQVTDEQRIAMEKLGAAAKKSADDLAAARTKFQGINDALKFSGNQLVDVLDRAMQKGAKFGDIMADVLRNVEKQLLQAAITGEGAFAKILGLSSAVPGGTGGLLGALFKGFGPAKAAEGTMNSPGGMTLVGERGPELVNLPKGAQVFPNDVTKQIMTGPTGVTIAMSNDFRGVDPASVNRIEAKLNEMQRTLPSQVASIVPDLRRRSARGF